MTSSPQQTLSEEWNGDTVTWNQDNPAEQNGGTVEQNQVSPETAVWNGDTVTWNQVVRNEELTGSQTRLKCGLQLTNELLFELD